MVALVYLDAGGRNRIRTVIVVVLEWRIFLCAVRCRQCCLRRLVTEVHADGPAVDGSRRQ